MTMISETDRTGAAAALSAIGGTTATGTADAEAWARQLRDAMLGMTATTAADDGDASALYGSLGASSASAIEAQAIGQSKEADVPSAEDTFMDFMSMTPMERMRAQILGNLGVTEEQLAALPPEERKKIEDKIRQIIEETVKREAEEKTAESAEPEAATSGTTATAAASAEDGKTNAAGATLEQVLPFLREDGGQTIGGKEAKPTNAANAEKDREEA